jgi:F-type H+-transporting ATPase subunit b
MLALSLVRRSAVIALVALAFVGTVAAFAAPPAGSADAAHGGHELVGAIPSVKQGAATGITALVVFIITGAFLLIVVWPKISKGLEDRAEKIRSEIDAAEMAQEQAKAALQQYEKNLADARNEAQRMLDQTKAQQAALAAELKAKADVELNLMREKAKRDIDTAKKAAVTEINDYATELASQMARRILQREIGQQDQQRLISESLSQVQSAVRSN